jgi:hypothetical protein
MTEESVRAVAAIRALLRLFQLLCYVRITRAKAGVQW